MEKGSKIYVAGHRGLLGSAICRQLKREGFENLLLRTSEELDLMNQESTFDFLDKEKPDYVFLCAAKVGGIKANLSAPVDFYLKNIQIQNNVLEGSRRAGVSKLLFVASSCIYPKNTQVPISEEQLLTGELEPTNEGYAMAKLAGVKACQFYRRQYNCNFISALPTNLFGVNDHYELETSHLLPALIHKIHLAKKNNQEEIVLWGTGQPRREFMLSDDCASALVFLMNHYDGEAPLNVGLGEDLSIAELAHAVAKELQVKIKITFDPTKPDGMMRKVLNIDKITRLGWKSEYSLAEGIRIAYKDFLARYAI